MVEGGTRRRRIPTSVSSPTYAREDQAAIHSGTGTRYSTTNNRTTIGISSPMAPTAVGSRSGICVLLARRRPSDDDPVAVHACHRNRAPGIDEVTIRHDIDPGAVELRDAGGSQRG